MLKPINQKNCWITTNGLASLSDNRFPLPPRKEIEVCKAFITKWIDQWKAHNPKFNSQRLVNVVKALGDVSVCKGAFILAALELNFNIYPCWWSERDTIFNMNYRRLENYWRKENIYVPV